MKPRQPLPPVPPNSDNADFPAAIGPYIPLRLLGTGGMAWVYLCVAPDGAEVAVKWLTRTEAKIRSRFEREGTLLTRVQHPNVARVLDTGVWEGRPFLVMRYVEGQDLRVFTRRLRLRPAQERLREVRRIGMALCDALAAVHAAGLVHRDVKPANVLLDHDTGQPVLSDFGVAKDLGDVERTRVGVLIGTAGYCSPEQVRGTNVDHRADLYGLGCTLFFMLTGQRPYLGSGREEVVRKHLHAPIPYPSAHDPTVPAALDATVMRLMAKAPDDRYQSADRTRRALHESGDDAAPPPLAGRSRYVDAVSRALARVEAGEGILLRPIGPSGSGRGWLLEVVEDLARRRGLTHVVARDRPTLAQALSRLDTGEVMVVATRLRTQTRPDMVEVHLPPLGLADVRRSLVSIAPDTPEPHRVAERLYRASGGHPAWMLALIDQNLSGTTLVLPSPPPTPPLIDDALDELEFEAIETLGTLAILGSPTSAPLLEQVTQLPVDAVLLVLEELGLVVRNQGLWRCLGSAVARAARSRIPDELAVQQRIEAAETLQAKALDDTLPELLEISLDEDRIRGIERTWRRGVLARGWRDIQIALAETRASGERRVELEALICEGSMLQDMGAPTRASMRFADAVALAHALDDDERRRAAHVLRASATLDLEPGAPGAASAALDRLYRALTRLDAPDEGGWLVLAAAVRARATASLMDRKAWSVTMTKAESQLKDCPPRLRGRVQLELARSALRIGDNARALDHADRCAVEAIADGDSLHAWLAGRIRARALGRAPQGPEDLGIAGLPPDLQLKLRARGD